MLVYADNAATTKIDKPVLDAMMPYLTTVYGNPGSVHQKGREAFMAVDSARSKVAKAINADPGEIYFTGDGTESDNWAIKGVAHKYSKKGKHIISTNIEHHAVLHSLMALEKEGYEITYLPVDANGFVSPEQLENAIRPDTVLITIMFANNEIGCIEPIKELGAVAKKHNVIFHTDAVQAVGHVPVDVKDMNIDLLSISAHKFNAPKGVGVLYMRKGIYLPALIDGGQQEKGRRAGTENVASIIGMGAAIEAAVREMPERTAKVEALRNKLRDGLVEKISHCKLNTPANNSLPGTLNISINYVEGEALLLSLDLKGICASSGSACTSGSLDPSHVLLAIGLTHEVAHGSVRFSLDHNNTEKEVDYILEVFPDIVKKLRDMSPLWEKVDK
ncbi:MAG: cysteine desulfurase NifS [Clostridiales bacterium]|nr:MAG: cysteine desulfurase NifS [Clostridiales bacterium]